MAADFEAMSAEDYLAWARNIHAAAAVAPTDGWMGLPPVQRLPQSGRRHLPWGGRCDLCGRSISALHLVSAPVLPDGIELWPPLTLLLGSGTLHPCGHAPACSLHYPDNDLLLRVVPLVAAVGSNGRTLSRSDWYNMALATYATIRVRLLQTRAALRSLDGRWPTEVINWFAGSGGNIPNVDVDIILPDPPPSDSVTVPLTPSTGWVAIAPSSPPPPPPPVVTPAVPIRRPRNSGRRVRSLDLPSA